MKITIYTQAIKYSWQNEFEIVNQTFQALSDRNQVVVDICEQKVEIDVPEIDQKSLTLAEVEQLKRQIVKEKAASIRKVAIIEERIQTLLCIENKPEDE